MSVHKSLENLGRISKENLEILIHAVKTHLEITSTKRLLATGFAAVATSYL